MCCCNCRRKCTISGTLYIRLHYMNCRDYWTYMIFWGQLTTTDCIKYLNQMFEFARNTWFLYIPNPFLQFQANELNLPLIFPKLIDYWSYHFHGWGSWLQTCNACPKGIKRRCTVDEWISCRSVEMLYTIENRSSNQDKKGRLSKIIVLYKILRHQGMSF